MGEALRVTEVTPVEKEKMAGKQERSDRAKSVVAYLQGGEGEEWELKVRTPDPMDKRVLDRTIFFPREAIKALRSQKEPDYFWVRVIVE